MGKQHSSEDKPGRRGAAGGSGRPAGDTRGGNSPRGNSSNYKGSRPDGRGEGYSPARPTFGQGSKFGSRPGGSGGLNKPTFGEKRSYGGDRPERGGYGEKRSYGDDRNARPRRDEPGNEGGERRDNRAERGERPAYPPKPIWQGQPVRYEGKPTVPRGGKGERNRKFIKTNPDGTPLTTDNDRPVYTGRDERRSFEEREPGQRPRPTGGFDRRDDRAPRRETGGRPAGDDRRNSYGDRRPAGDETTDRRRFGGEQGGSDRRSSGGRDARSAQSSRDDRRSSYGSDRDTGRERTEGAFGKSRSYGERPTNTGGGTFRERREAMREAQSGPRRGTTYGSADKGRSGDAVGQAPDYKNLGHYEKDKTRGNKRRASEEDFGNEELRLNRYIANAGICSRREADALIAAGEIRVNGEVVTEMGYKVQPTDTVQYGKTNLNREKLVYVLLNKPKDFITTTDDPEGRKTVMSLVATASKERIFPVGRLDRNTTGLLLFTNDGEVAQKLSHPSHKNKKIYQAELDKPLTAEHLGQIAAGLELEDGKAEVDDVAVVAGNPHFVGIELHVGRNRIVRRIFEHLGYDVVALDRVQYAGLTKKELPRGKWRFLSEQEVIRLKYFM